MRSRRRDETGSALVEMTWLGVLLLVPLVWIVVSVFEVQRGAFAVDAAARAAGRAYALAPDERTALARARAVAAQTLKDQGGDGMKAEVRVTCSNGPGTMPGGDVGDHRRGRLRRRPAGDAEGAQRAVGPASCSSPATPSRSGSTSRRRREAGMAGERSRDERGQVSLLIIGFAAVLLLAIAVVLDASAAYLHRQGLSTLADGAALQGADLGATGVYAEGLPDERLPWTRTASARRWRPTWTRSGPDRRFPGPEARGAGGRRRPDWSGSRCGPRSTCRCECPGWRSRPRRRRRLRRGHRPAVTGYGVQPPSLDHPA